MCAPSDSKESNGAHVPEVKGHRWLHIQRRLGIEVIPPLALALQVLSEPSLDGLHPAVLSLGLEDVVVFACDLYELDRTPEDLQRIVQRSTFAGRDVHVSRAVEEEQRRVNLVCIEEWAVLGVEVGVVPRETTFGGHRAVAESPVAPSPVAGDRANTCVADCSGKEVGARLQVLRHKAPIASLHR